MEIIKTEHLTKQYGNFKAVSDMNLHVRKGEIYGFLGLNGAGKTTTIRMLLGLIKPTSGYAYILGEKAEKENNNLWNRIGYMVETPYAYPNLTVKENLVLFQRMRSIKDKYACESIAEKLGISQYFNRKAKHLSKGNKQRLGLAKAMIHNPEILILDEPTDGLDPEGKHDIREMIKNFAKKDGVTVFISSHILDEISKLATRIGIIHNGKLITEIDSIELNTLCEKRLYVKTKDQDIAVNILEEAGYQNCSLNEELLIIKDLEAIEKPDKVATILVNQGYPPLLLQPGHEDLESYFLRTINQKEN